MEQHFTDEWLERMTRNQDVDSVIRLMAKDFLEYRKAHAPIYVFTVDEVPDLSLTNHEISDGEMTSEEIVKMWGTLKREFIRMENQLAGCL